MQTKFGFLNREVPEETAAFLPGRNDIPGNYRPVIMVILANSSRPVVNLGE